MTDRNPPAQDTLLLQFRRSPYNEKARWALDRLRLPHWRESLLPGPHMRRVRALTGQTATPILRLDGRWIAGSARILDVLAERSGAPWLTGPDAESARRAREIERRFDEDWVPRIRRCVLDSALSDPRYFARVFGSGRPPMQQRLYALVVPLAAPLVRAGNGIRGQASIDDGLAALDEALAFVVRETQHTGHLAGEAFGRADLCAAAALATIASPPDSPMQRPESPPPKVLELAARFEAHPGLAWVRRIYAQHRAARDDFEGRSPY